MSFRDIRQDRANVRGTAEDCAIRIMNSQNLLTSMLHEVFEFTDLVRLDERLVILTKLFKSKLGFPMCAISEHGRVNVGYQDEFPKHFVGAEGGMCEECLQEIVEAELKITQHLSRWF